jgi:DNA replication protein DnaC
MTELELLDRERRAIERRIRQAKFPVTKSLDSFDFIAMPTLNKAMVLELARCEFLARNENVLLLGNSGTCKTHIALALGLSACQHGHRVRFTTASALVSELIEARDEKKLLRFQKQIASYELLIVDELGFVPLSKTGAELLFEMLSQRYERGSTMVTSNLPFAEWTEVLGSERLTGALLDRLTHHVHILEMNGDSFRLKQSRRNAVPSTPEPGPDLALSWVCRLPLRSRRHTPRKIHCIYRSTFTPPQWLPFTPSLTTGSPSSESECGRAYGCRSYRSEPC